MREAVAVAVAVAIVALLGRPHGGPSLLHAGDHLVVLLVGLRQHLIAQNATSVRALRLVQSHHPEAGQQTQQAGASQGAL